MGIQGTVPFRGDQGTEVDAFAMEVLSELLSMYVLVKDGKSKLVLLSEI